MTYFKRLFHLMHNAYLLFHPSNQIGVNYLDYLDHFQLQTFQISLNEEKL